MIKLYDECVGCPPELGCLGDACKNLRTPHYFCDTCHQEEDLYYYDGKELCIECIKNELVQVDFYAN